MVRIMRRSFAFLLFQRASFIAKHQASSHTKDSHSISDQLMLLPNSSFASRMFSIFQFGTLSRMLSTIPSLDMPSIGPNFQTIPCCGTTNSFAGLHLDDRSGSAQYIHVGVCGTTSRGTWFTHVSLPSPSRKRLKKVYLPSPASDEGGHFELNC